MPDDRGDTPPGTHRTSPAIRHGEAACAPATRVVVGAAVLGLIALAVWEGTVAHQSADAHWSVGAVIAATAAAMLAAGRGRQRQRSGDWARRSMAVARGGGRQHPASLVAGVVVWGLLAAAAISWDMNSFAHQAHDLPTLSSLIGHVTRFAGGRAVLFAAWVGGGGYVAAGWRARRRARSSGGAHARSGRQTGQVP